MKELAKELMSEENEPNQPKIDGQSPDSGQPLSDSVSPPAGNPLPVRAPIKKPRKPSADKAENKPQDNKVVKLLERNPLGMTLPEMAGGTRQLKKIRTLRPILGESIRAGLVMPVSQRAGHTVYRLVKNLTR